VPDERGLLNTSHPVWTVRETAAPIDGGDRVTVGFPDGERVKLAVGATCGTPWTAARRCAGLTVGSTGMKLSVTVY